MIARPGFPDAGGGLGLFAGGGGLAATLGFPAGGGGFGLIATLGFPDAGVGLGFAMGVGTSGFFVAGGGGVGLDLETTAKVSGPMDIASSSPVAAAGTLGLGGFGVSLGLGFAAGVGADRGLAAGVGGEGFAALGGGSTAIGRLAGAGLAAVDSATGFSLTLNPPAAGGLDGSEGGAFFAGLVDGGSLAVAAAATGNTGGA